MNWLRIVLMLLIAVPGLVVAASAQKVLPLEEIEDTPLPGGATRFDYQHLNNESGRLYIAHLGANSLVVFDTKLAVIDDQTYKVVARVPAGNYPNGLARSPP